MPRTMPPRTATADAPLSAHHARRPVARLRLHGAALLVTALLLSVAACEADDDHDDIALVNGVAVGTHALLAAEDGSRAYLLDVDSEQLATRITLPPDLRLLTTRRGAGGEALVLSGGLRGVGDGATLTRLDDGGTRATYALDAPFDALSQGEEGRFAVAHHGTAPDRVVFSPNVVAVVDLDGTGESAITHVALRSPGGAPLGVTSPPPMQIGEETRELAVVRWRNHVGILDLARADAGALVVQLGGEGPEAAVTPSQIVAEPDAGRLYVRCDDGHDIFVLTLSPGAEAGELTVRVAQVAGGEAPADMARVGAGQLLVTDATGGSMRLIDLLAATTRALPTDTPHTQVLGYERGDGSRVLVLYRPGSEWIGLAEAEDFAADPGASTTLRELDAAVEAIQALPGQDRALVRHAAGQFGILDLGGYDTLLLGLPEGDATLTTDSGSPTAWIWSPHSELVGFLRMDSGRSGEVLLGAPALQAVPVPGAERAVFTHADGTASILDARAPATPIRVRVAE